MAVVVAISFAMFAHHDKVRNHFGKRFVEGYVYWRAETEIDDDGREYYPGDNWTSKSSTGRWTVRLFSLGLWVAVFAVPALTWQATKSAISAHLAPDEKGNE
jgi:hypothetical protein